MKVLVIGSRIPFPLHDGGAIATYNMLKGLSDNGVDVSYFSLNTHKHFVDDATLEKEFTFLGKIKSFSIDTKLQVTDAFLNLFSGSSYNIDRFYSKDFEALLLNEIRDNTYDIIHFEGLFVARYVESVRSEFKIPTLLRQHNVEYRIWETLAENEKNPLKKWYLNLLARRIKTFEQSIAMHFDQIVTIATTDEEQMKDWKGLKCIDTIPGGFKIPLAPASQKEISHSAYHIGSMEWLPNRQAMEWFHLAIWPLVVRAVPDAQFYMAGKNMPFQYNEWACANFHVLGEVMNAADFAAEKQLLVVPLLSASGIRIKTIEAMMSGKAVVTTTLGAKGLPVISGTHCMLADTARDFAESIITLFKEEGKRKAIQEEGKQLMATHFDINKVTAQWIATYQSLLVH